MKELIQIELVEIDGGSLAGCLIEGGVILVAGKAGYVTGLCCNKHNSQKRSD